MSDYMKTVNVDYSCGYGSFNVDVDVEDIEGETDNAREARIDMLVYNEILLSLESTGKIDMINN